MFLNRLAGLFSRDMGIDLGTANTLVCLVGEGIVLSEPSVVAVKRGTNQVLDNGNAVGNVAKEMIGQDPRLHPGHPPHARRRHHRLRNHARRCSSTSSARSTAAAASSARASSSPSPRGITAVEKQAVIDSAQRAGARKVYLIDEPKAAGIGVGLPIIEPVGNMIVDIGGGTTEVAVISLGGIVTRQSVRIAGDDMDEAIINYMKRTYNLLIGEPHAPRRSRSRSAPPPRSKRN